MTRTESKPPKLVELEDNPYLAIPSYARPRFIQQDSLLLSSLRFTNSETKQSLCRHSDLNEWRDSDHDSAQRPLRTQKVKGKFLPFGYKWPTDVSGQLVWHESEQEHESVGPEPADNSNKMNCHSILSRIYKSYRCKDVAHELCYFWLDSKSITWGSKKQKWINFLNMYKNFDLVALYSTSVEEENPPGKESSVIYTESPQMYLVVRLKNQGSPVLYYPSGSSLQKQGLSTFPGDMVKVNNSVGMEIFSAITLLLLTSRLTLKPSGLTIKRLAFGQGACESDYLAFRSYLCLLQKHEPDKIVGDWTDFLSEQQKMYILGLSTKSKDSANK